VGMERTIWSSETKPKSEINGDQTKTYQKWSDVSLR
jgi:hypothetical protein